MFTKYLQKRGLVEKTRANGETPGGIRLPKTARTWEDPQGTAPAVMTRDRLCSIRIGRIAAVRVDRRVRPPCVRGADRWFGTFHPHAGASGIGESFVRS